MYIQKESIRPDVKQLVERHRGNENNSTILFVEKWFVY